MSRTIVNHNAQAWADDYLALSDRSMAHASEIETSGTAHPLHWHIHGQLQSIGRLAFDIQACILRANQTTDKEPDMNSQIMPCMPLGEALNLTFNPGETCDALVAAIHLIEQELDDDPNNNDLYLAKAALRQAITSIDGADGYIAMYTQSRVDRDAVDAVVTALRANYGSESNAGPANGMLADIASPAGAAMILRVIRDAGYVISPAPPF